MCDRWWDCSAILLDHMTNLPLEYHWERNKELPLVWKSWMQHCYCVVSYCIILYHIVWLLIRGLMLLLTVRPFYEVSWKLTAYSVLYGHSACTGYWGTMGKLSGQLYNIMQEVTLKCRIAHWRYWSFYPQISENQRITCL